MRLLSSRRAAACATASFIALWAAGPVLAQTPPIKPGLWEVQSEREVDGKKAAAPGDRMKNLPPEARAKVEAMMKERGVAMGEGGNTRTCLTKESIAAGRLQAQAAGCTTDYASKSGSTWKFHSSCPALKAESEGEIVFAGTDNYTVTVATTLGSMSPPHHSRTIMKGHWVGASCGDLQPLSPKP